MKKIALIGECMIELNGEPFSQMLQTYGGDSLNTAVYLSRIASDNTQVHYVTAMGSDPLSVGMINRWEGEGVNTELVLTDQNRQPGLYLIQLDEHGERTFLYWRNQSAARFLLRHPLFDQVERQILQMDMIYLSGISLAILPQADREILIEMLQLASQKGVKIAFDSNYRPALWDSAEQAKQCYSEVLAVTDLALVTNDDERLLWGDDSDEQTLARLHAAGVKRAVLKRGKEACIYRDFITHQQEQVMPNKVEHVVDTTSAGDSFNAGFLAAWLAEQSPTRCAELGHQMAGTVIQHKGAIIAKDAMAHIHGIQPDIKTKEVI